jgi:hypothetical protein
MVEIKCCKLIDDAVPGLEEAIVFYQSHGQTHCADITCVIGLVGRVEYNSRTWAILDRNGEVGKRSYDLEGYVDDTAAAAAIAETGTGPRH